jgi:hypothetical protein
MRALTNRSLGAYVMNMDNTYAQLIQQARTVLDGNWMGYATKPAVRLYPHHWSWDAAFIAIGYAHYDQARAEQELRSLFHGQWANGLLPHIVFNPTVRHYAPDPAFWEIERSPHAPRHVCTSGIVQPPLHATAAWQIYRHAQDTGRARAFLMELFPKLRAWHAYLYRERDVDGDGLIYIRHPWESGQDNSPIWDQILARMVLTPELVPPYQRADTSLVHSAERPSDAEYDRYAYLVKLFRDHDYDEARIRASCPFLVQDVLFNTLLVQANIDLASIAHLLGANPAPMLELAQRTATALNQKLWVSQDQHGIYVDYDLVAKEQIHAQVAAGFSPLFAGVPSMHQAGHILTTLNTSGFCRLGHDCWAVPSFDKGAPGYSPRRYWRGPIWININWILYRGLQRYGFTAYANRVRQAIIELPRRSGFYEYFDPDLGQGYGAENFSWTAALLLDTLLGQAGEQTPLTPVHMDVRTSDAQDNRIRDS